MLGGRQSRGSSGEGPGVQEAAGLAGTAGEMTAPRSPSFPAAPTSDMPGTTPNPCGRTWPRWGWLWTPTRRCPSARERYWLGAPPQLAGFLNARPSPRPPSPAGGGSLSHLPLPPSQRTLGLGWSFSTYCFSSEINLCPLASQWYFPEFLFFCPYFPYTLPQVIQLSLV